MVASSNLFGSQPEPDDEAGRLAATDAPAPVFPSYVRTMRRFADQCVLTLSLYNLTPDFTVSPPAIRRIDDTKPNYLAVEFGALDAAAPQHVQEHAYPLKTGELNNVAQKPAPTPRPTSSNVQDPPVTARLSGPSRLVFVIPDAAVEPGASHRLLFDTDHLLDWVALGLNVAPNAVAPGAFASGVAPSEPGLLHTAIEMPYRLIISPPHAPLPLARNNERSVFVNATEPVTHDGWTELWHTRLAASHLVLHGQLGVVEVDETWRAGRTIRAIWCTDPDFAADLRRNATEPTELIPQFTGSLRYTDRYDIVRLSSDFTPTSKGGPYQRAGNSASGVPLGTPFVPSPATVDRLMLSSLGGWLSCDAHWDLPNAPQKLLQPSKFNSSLLSWRHRAVQGRDSYVRVVRKGYLFPWGHRASLITVTEREFSMDGNDVGAYLRQKTFIVVGQPVKDYGGADDFAPFGGRKIPFTSVESITLVTPDLSAPTGYTNSQHGNDELVFEPMLGGAPFRFHFRGTDWAGDPIDFRSPVLWVDDTVSYADASSATLIDKVISKWRDNYPVINLHNQRVSLASPKDPDSTTGDTQVVIASFELGADHPVSGASATQLVDASQPAFYPALHTLSVNLPEAKTASGNAVAASTLEYETDHYLANGFTGNPGGVFLRRVPSAKRNAIMFRGDKAGGAVTPNLGIDGYSREIGPTSGDIAQLAKGKFDPKKVFDGVEAKLLGGLELSTILGLVPFGDGAADGNGPALQLTSVEKTNPHRVVTTLDWHPVIINGGPTIAGQQITIFEVQDPDGQYPVDSSPNAASVDGSSDSMDLHALVVTDLDDPAKSSATVIGQIRDFNLDLFGNGETYFIQIPFDSLTFRAQSGKKTDVDVRVGSGGVQFQGALSFVQDLASYLNFDGSGLVIDTSGAAITATLTLAIPSIGVGVFALENLAFSAGVAIPYNGDPVRFTFAFCSRENPFQLEIMIFTGGGFVGLGIGADGVELLEFGFDFGLGISIDVGIASGQISLVGGVSYEAQKEDDGTQDVDLTAYVKASGGISALGIVSVSVELYLGMSYESPPSQLVGDAEMTISVHILFFGGSVGFSVHEEFAGSSDAPQNAQRRVRTPQAIPAGGPKADAAFPANTFGGSMSETDWAAYCTSFALVGVGV